ncbi:hypothetical protein NOF55_20945 [Rhizobiaceae bacterium BDR2-2]|uniref:Uncharacterized protein n=1 Tax=Ectorhizobium quercum TaxID=2965071 RepID=A0AAE3SWV1_9HYPH|nr:DUF6656 family protein [Ectorhizobium quercum]MCX8999577.1 hypothetical protein [Ectorhizobium quercum]
MNNVAMLSGRSAKPEGRRKAPPKAVVEHKQAATPAPSRYGHWFYGEKVAIRKLRQITDDMTAGEVADATRENLALIGEETCKRITAKLPSGHTLHKAVRAATLLSAPHLGACKFGEIITDYEHDRYDLVQVFLANFSGQLDTSDTTHFLKPLSRSYDQMFFGLHVQVDRAGNPLGFNRNLGVNGIAFQTRDLVKAFFHVAATSTGTPEDTLRARATPPRA